jgi:hypothetical protein
MTTFCLLGLHLHLPKKRHPFHILKRAAQEAPHPRHSPPLHSLNTDACVQKKRIHSLNIDACVQKRALHYEHRCLCLQLIRSASNIPSPPTFFHSEVLPSVAEGARRSHLRPSSQLHMAVVFPCYSKCGMSMYLRLSGPYLGKQNVSAFQLPVPKCRLHHLVENSSIASVFLRDL